MLAGSKAPAASGNLLPQNDAEVSSGLLLLTTSLACTAALGQSMHAAPFIHRYIHKEGT